MLPREKLEFQNLRNAILPHSGRHISSVFRMMHLLQFKVKIVVIIFVKANGKLFFFSFNEWALFVGCIEHVPSTRNKGVGGGGFSPEILDF